VNEGMKKSVNQCYVLESQQMLA